MIHLSRWWNPAVEDQATDRAYRIGQTRPVTIHIPMAIHPDEAIGPSSFDQRLDALMERKRSLSRGLLMPPESERDVEDLLADVLDGKRAEQQDQSVTAPETEPLSPQERSSYSIEPPALTEPQVSHERLNVSASETSPPAPEDTATPSSTEDESARPTGKPDEIASVQSNTPSVRRPILSVRTPVEAAEARAFYVQRVVFEQHGPRDWTIFEQYARDANIALLEIQDPYCCADGQARGRLVNFISRFGQLASQIAAVHVVAFDADSVQTREPESTNDQRRDLEERWNRMLASVQLHLAQKSRRSVGDLHDRFVKARLANGDSVIWDLGRGIDGIMSARWSCVVNAFYERASPNSSLMH